MILKPHVLKTFCHITWSCHNSICHVSKHPFRLMTFTFTCYLWSLARRRITRKYIYCFFAAIITFNYTPTLIITSICMSGAVWFCLVHWSFEAIGFRKSSDQMPFMSIMMQHIYNAKKKSKKTKRYWQFSDRIFSVKFTDIFLNSKT